MDSTHEILECASEYATSTPLKNVEGGASLLADTPSVRGRVIYTGDNAAFVGQSDPRTVEVHNGRLARQIFSLDVTGFELLRLQAPLEGDLFNPADVANLYEVVASYVAEATGAAGKVIIFDHICRDEDLLRHEYARGVPRGSEGATQFLKKPCYYVHNDYTVRSGYTRARQLLQHYCHDVDLDRALQGRFAIINFWYPLNEVLKDPLGMITWTSTRPHDVQPIQLNYEHRTGEVYDAYYSEDHSWVHFPNMDPNEALLFKTFDSDTSVAQFALHSAIELDDIPSFAETRRSVEIRCLVFYDATPDGFAKGFEAPHLLPGSPDAADEVSLLERKLLPRSYDAF